MRTEGKRNAIIVGVSKYEKAELGDLRYTGNDARRLASVLEEYCGFPGDTIHLFCDDEGARAPRKPRAPTYADVLATTQEVSQRGDEDDLILFFFAGHGNEISGEPYLLMNDTRLNVINDTAISMRKINRYLEESRAKAKIRIFDACRAAFGARDLGSLRMRSGFEKALLETPQASVTLCSCSGGELALEHQDFEQGVFSYYLCEGLAGAAANDDGTITVERLADYVKTSVGNWCKLHTHKQTPHFVCNIEGTLVLVQMPSAQRETSQEPGEASPVARLSQLYDERLAACPDDLREAQLTTIDEAREVYELLSDTVRHEYEELNSPYIELKIDGPASLRVCAPYAQNEFMVALTESGLKPEFLDERALRLDFRPSRIAIPYHKLVICVARCTFCYWIWCGDFFERSEHLKSWTPEHRLVTESYTILPAAARNKDKMTELVRSVTDWVAATVDAWSREITKYLDERMTPIRESSRIIK